MRKFLFLFTSAFLFAGSITAEDTFELYGKTQEAWKKKDFAGFLGFAERLVSLSPGHSGVQFQYARALAANGRIEEALQTLNRVARIGGSPPAREDEAFATLKDRPEFKAILKAFEQNRMRSGFSDVVVVIPGKDLIPEGIAYDPVGKKYYVGSTYRRKILEIDSSGKVREFAGEKQDGLFGIVGMEVDPVRRHLWANTANAGAIMRMIDSDPATEGKTAVFKYDLRTGKLIKKYESGSKEKPHFFNDVAIASNGDVFLTQSSAGEVYKVDAKTDSLTLMIASGSMGFPNGIAVSEDGKFLYISHLEGISVVNTSSGERQMLTGPPDTQTGNHDGMVYFRNSLVGIQALTGSVDRIVRLHLENPKHVGRVEVLQVNHPLFALPTTGDMVGDEFHYIANSQLRSFDEKGNIFPPEKLQDTFLLKVDLLDSEKEELRAVHEREREAHLKTDLDLLLFDAPGEFVTVSSGKIHRVTQEEERKMFKGYFQGAVYSEYRDLESPIISVSQDGRSGYVITRTQVKRIQGEKKQEFVYAGIMTYEKRGDNWVRVANVSTFE